MTSTAHLAAEAIDRLDLKKWANTNKAGFDASGEEYAGYAPT